MGPVRSSALRPFFTVPISAVQGLLSAARGQGVATPDWLETVLQPAGIDPKLVEQNASRVTVEQYVALFNAVKDSLDDECVGLLSRPFRRGSFALLARSTLGARSLEVALRRLAEGFRALQEDVALVCVSEAPLGGVAVELRDAATARENYLHELLLRVFWRLLAWLHGGRMVPRRFDFGFERPGYAADYAQIFPGELRFGQPRSAVWFDAAALAGPVRRDADAFQSFLRAAPGNLIGPRLVEQVASARVRTLLQRTCPAWPDLAATADHLHMSVSALQRHLAAEGTSFQTLKDELRRDTAIVRLTTTQAPLASLAADLGFTDSTAFQRAFKSWTGSPPGSYRAQMKGDISSV